MMQIWNIFQEDISEMFEVILSNSMVLGSRFVGNKERKKMSTQELL